MFPVWQSLRFRLLLLVSLAILPLVGLTLYSGLEQRKLAGEEAKSEALRLARLVAGHHSALLEGARQLLLTLEQAPQIRNGDVADCDAFLSGLANNLPNYTGLLLIGPNGEALCHSFPTVQHLQLADRPYFQEALQNDRMVIGEPVIGRASGKIVLPVAYPVAGAGGQMQSVLIAPLDLSWVNELAPTIGLPPESVVRITDSQGLVLARYPDPELYVGKTIQDTGLLTTLLEAEAEGTAELTGVDSVKRLYSFIPIKTTGEKVIYFSVGIPSQIAFAEADRSLNRNLFIVGVVGFLALAVAWISSQVVLMRPIQELRYTTRRLAAGDLGARSRGINVQGELGELASAFNGMAAALQGREEELKHAEARYRMLVEQIPVIVYTTRLDAGGNPSYISPQVEKTIGFTSQEWLADPDTWKRQLHPEDCERVLAEREASTASGAPFQSEYRLYDRQGDLLWVRDEARVVTDEAGRPVGIQGVLTDITGLKQAEEDLKSYSLQLERSNRELQDFAYISSHDLQEPLRKILAFGDRLATRYQETLGEEGIDYLQRMRGAATRMQTLINDLLAYSRVTTKARPFRRVNLKTVVQEVCTDLEDLIARTGGIVEVGELGTLEADETQMRQLMQNLIGNGLKFHRPEEPPQVRVAMQYHSQSIPGDRFRTRPVNTVQIIVEDNGIGFDEKYLDRIFQPFQRLHERGVYDGSGIGLAICRKIVERHGGSLKGQSTPGQGSKFIVTLPAHQ